MTKEATAAHAAVPYKAWSVRHHPSEQERWCIVTYDPARGMHWPVEGSEQYEYESDARRAADLLNKVHAEAARTWMPLPAAPETEDTITAAAQEEYNRWVSDLTRGVNTADAFEAGYRAALAQRRDGERLEWLGLRLKEYPETSVGEDDDGWWIDSSREMILGEGKTLREAIDKAMGLTHG